MGPDSPFADNDLERELEIVDLNVRSTVHLAKRVLRDMKERDGGSILVTSSIAATMPGSFQAVCNASKSSLLSVVATQNELKDTGITLMMPGRTETDFFDRVDMDDTKVGRQYKDDPAEVARQGLDALFSGKDKRVAGSMQTKEQGLDQQGAARSAKAEAHRKVAEPGSGERDGD
ncbi:SDR family NAD(P)-dependent oxidoreductase [Streptomyces hundungensis]|uniref:SDR family NAD(P)-dependent oxidoreductase n=1 Tax=Streptomyces hundungensis TaxID=1077946 RepID=UPI0033FDAB42